MVKVSVGSNAAVHTPGVLGWARNLWSSRKKRDRDQAVEITNALLFRGRDAEAARQVLDCLIPVTVEGDSVSFEYAGEAYRQVEFKVALRFARDLTDEELGKVRDEITEVIGRDSDYGGVILADDPMVVAV